MEPVVAEAKQYGPISPPSTLSQLPLNPTNYAFLVHSQHTLPHNLSPNVDDQKLYRQRRRRTSPEDQAILEAEFETNPKPDKLARKAIVERLAGMGEKEVQIWFQNRRQNTRRRSRPLTSEEFAALVHPSAKDPVCSTQDSNHSASDDDRILAARSNSNTSSSTLDNFGRQRNSQEHGQDPALAPTVPPQDTSARPLKRSLSGVRLSTTSHGAAQLLQDSEPSPSPPKPSPRAALPTSTSKISNSSSSASRLPAGRSRNSRAWEFWCDADARTDLEKKADQEQSGSATDAISLMRSSSSRSILQPLEVRGSPQPTAKRHRPGDEALAKPYLGRAHSSVARLQHRRAAGFELHDDGADASRGLKSASRAGFSPSGDSDKENFDPDGNIPSISRRRSNSGLSKSGGERSTLRASRTAPVQRAPTVKKHKSNHAASFDPEEDEELARFMGSSARTGRGAAALSSAEDFDCVQGLLSLSQGWK